MFHRLHSRPGLSGRASAWRCGSASPGGMADGSGQHSWECTAARPLAFDGQRMNKHASPILLVEDNPDDAELWESVRKTYAEINGTTYKPVKNLKGWYEKLHTDGAEYKMWGNGIALPCAEYVLSNIAEIEASYE